ncbi:MAG TPA: hypothetical protein VMU82_00395 [Acetobacteraceae bacterium]|nr:hypothetical protein [Acetobacteraceae bacterium]
MRLQAKSSSAWVAYQIGGILAPDFVSYVLLLPRVAEMEAAIAKFVDAAPAPEGAALR